MPKVTPGTGRARAVPLEAIRDRVWPSLRAADAHRGRRAAGEVVA